MSMVRKIGRFTALALSTMLIPAQAQAPAPGTIGTIAGGPPNRVSALSVSTEAEGVVEDSAGDVYTTSPDFGLVLKISPAGETSTFAGNASYGYSGDGGPATSAQLGCPVGMALDGSNNLFLADFCDNVVREVVASTGIIRTVAGDGSPGYSGDGALATGAQLNQPSGVSVDAAGNLFVADSGNNVIREIVCATGASGCTPPAGETAGDIYTVAGSGAAGYSGDGAAAGSATLNGPFAISLDSNGDLFIADSYNNVIREVVCATRAANCTAPAGEAVGYIFTVAGDGTAGYAGDGGPATSAELDQPSGVFADVAGNLFIADSANCVIREISAATIHTVAGSGAPGFGGDGGSALGAALNYPVAIWADGAGNLLIGDTENNRIREVSNGNIATIAGNGFPSYSGDGGSATRAQMAFPLAMGVGVATDPAGNVFIADAGANVVREVAASTGDIGTIAGTGSFGFSGDNGPAASAALNAPSGVAVDASGNLFIADTLNNVVREVSASSADISTIAGDGTAGYAGDDGPATSARLQQPFGVALDRAGDLFIADTSNNVVREVVCATGAGPCQPPSGEVAGDIYTVAGNGTPGYTGDGGAATRAELQLPTGLSLDPQGDIFIADSANNVIREVSGGLIQTVAGNGLPGYGGDNGPAASAMLNQPYGVSVDDAGNLFIADTDNNVIREVVCATSASGCQAPSGETAGDIYAISGDGNGGFSGDGGPAANAELGFPLGVAMGPAGDFLFADGEADRVRRLAGVADIVGASLSPGSLTFTPAQVLGASPSSQSVTLANPGTFPLTISNIALSGSPDFAESTTCGALPASVAPGQSCQLTTRFRASSVGPRTALLTITDSARTSPQGIPVSGAGIDFSLGMAPGAFNTTTISAGGSASFALQVSATGGFSSKDQLAVTISCAGAPPSATCSGPASPVPLTPSTPGECTVRVATTASSSLPLLFSPRPFPPLQLFTFFALFSLLTYFAGKARHAGSGRRGSGRGLGLSLAPALLLLLATCASGCGTTRHGGGTPPGTYILAVQGTSGGVSRSLQLTLTVRR